MTNLEIMGVQEMDAMEMRTENGGILPLIAFCIYVAPVAVITSVAVYEAIREK